MACTNSSQAESTRMMRSTTLVTSLASWSSRTFVSHVEVTLHIPIFSSRSSSRLDKTFGGSEVTHRWSFGLGATRIIKARPYNIHIPRKLLTTSVVQERYHLDYNYEDKDPESWLKSSFPARYLYEYLLPKIVQEEHPGIAYHPTSPWGDGKDTSDPTVGDIHQWNSKFFMTSTRHRYA